jgi:hypothetical protein
MPPTQLVLGALELVDDYHYPLKLAPPLVLCIQNCRNPTLRECEDEIHIHQMGTWESSKTPENSEFDCKGQNTVVYITGKLLKCKCPKWARMTHLDIYNTSYGQKKGRESNWQFDPQPREVGNRPDSLACRWRATCRWKALDEGYNLG